MMREPRVYNSKNHNKVFLSMMLLVITLVLTGCSGSTNPSSKTGPKYYQGYESIEMKFLEESPPFTFYYDSEADNIQENTLPIMVELYNKGSSNSYGALFVHGLDPNIIAIQGYTPNYPGYTGTGRWDYQTFSGWYGDSSNYALNIMGVNLGNSVLNLGVASIGGRNVVSFSTFSGINDRASLFQSLGFGTAASRYNNYVGTSPYLGDYHVGAALNLITAGMFNNFGWNEWLKKFEMEGRSSDNPPGGMEVVEFPATILTLPPSLEEFRQRVMVTACFDYATHASKMVCIDPEPYSNVRKACKPQTVSLSGGQGAPVSITTIEQRPGRGRTTFVINIRHSSKNAYDELYDYFSLYKCDPSSGEVVKATDKNVVYVGYVYLSDIDITMSCVPDQVIRLDSSGNGQITCSIEFPEGMATSAYEAPMEIELWYGYSKTIYRDVIVRRI